MRKKTNDESKQARIEEKAITEIMLFTVFFLLSLYTHTHLNNALKHNDKDRATGGEHKVIPMQVFLCNIYSFCHYKPHRILADILVMLSWLWLFFSVFLIGSQCVTHQTEVGAPEARAS